MRSGGSERELWEREQERPEEEEEEEEEAEEESGVPAVLEADSPNSKGDG